MTAINDLDGEITGGDVTAGMLTVMSVELNTQGHRSLQADQQIIYNFFLSLVRTVPPEIVLAEFRSLFISPGYDISSKPQQALYNIVSLNNEIEFKNTLKRSCYILINKWHFNRQYVAIRQLIELFSTGSNRPTGSVKLVRQGNWLNKFSKSKDFEEMKIFALKHEEKEPIHWSDRYTSYLLVPQYLKNSNPLEQRQAAKTLAQQLKEKFKYDLAMYTARAVTLAGNKYLKNPTGLGDDVLELIRKVVTRKGEYSYVNLANIFLNQTQGLSYGEFKLCLKRYLIFSLANQDWVTVFEAKLHHKLKSLYEKEDDRDIDRQLILKTCQVLLEFLTIDNNQLPGEVFVLFISQRRSLTLVILLLKLVLICQQCRTHLEVCIANLIEYYKKVPESDCGWVIHFVEIFNIVFTIYNEDVEYNLIKIEDNSDNGSVSEGEKYRVFSQVRRNSKIGKVSLENNNL